MKYFPYLRKSTNEKNKQVMSIGTQRRVTSKLIVENNLQVVEELIEKESAYEGIRPVFDEMIQRFKKGEANGLIVAHIDRISRNGRDSGEITELFKEGIIKEIRTPSKTYSTIEDMLYLDIELAMSADYSRRLSKRVKEGLESKFLKGEHCGPAPIGYSNKDGKIYPHPMYGELITEAFELYATGEFSVESLADWLFEHGLRSKKASNKVYPSVIHRQLIDPTYYGVVKKGSRIHAGIHTPLTNKSVFDIVQDVLVKKSVHKQGTHLYLYRDFLDMNCGNCTCSYTASLKKGHNYYYCTNGKNICNQHIKYLREEKVEALIEEVLTGFELDPQLADISFELYAESIRESDSFVQKSLERLQQELDEIAKKRDRLLDSLIANKITQERFDKKDNELEKLEADTTIQLKNLKKMDVNTTLEQVKEIKEDCCNMLTMFKEGDDLVKQDLLKSVLWNLSIKDGKVASVQYKKPYSYLQNLNKNTDILEWRREWDSNPR